jgi:hypothetical protein
MSNIKNIDRVIMEIKKMLLTNENIRKLLGNNTPSALQEDAPTKANVSDLILTTPAVYMNEDDSNVKYNTFCVIYTPLLQFNAQMNDLTFVIDLFTRKELIEINNNQLRLHQLLGEIVDTIDNKRISMAGRIQFSTATYINMGNRYLGFQVEMSVLDEAVENDF